MNLVFHHIGIYCPNIVHDKEKLISTFNLEEETDLITDHNLKVCVQFFLDKHSNIRYELVEPLGDKNPVSNTLQNQNNNLNHIAYTTNDWKNTLVSLRKSKYIPIGKQKFAKAFNNEIQFFYTPFKTIIELIKL